MKSTKNLIQESKNVLLGEGSFRTPIQSKVYNYMANSGVEEDVLVWYSEQLEFLITQYVKKGIKDPKIIANKLIEKYAGDDLQFRSLNRLNTNTGKVEPRAERDDEAFHRGYKHGYADGDVGTEPYLDPRYTPLQKKSHMAGFKMGQEDARAHQQLD